MGVCPSEQHKHTKTENQQSKPFVALHYLDCVIAAFANVHLRGLKRNCEMFLQKVMFCANVCVDIFILGATFSGFLKLQKHLT